MFQEEMLPASYYWQHFFLKRFCIFGTKQTNRQQIDSSAEKNSAKKKSKVVTSMILNYYNVT